MKVDKNKLLVLSKLDGDTQNEREAYKFLGIAKRLHPKYGSAIGGMRKL